MLDGVACVARPAPALAGRARPLLGLAPGRPARQPRARAEVRAGRTAHADDRSLQVHACHGPARQVDVLREVLVGLLDDDPTLEPRDILVMCPDIETYAPLIAAAFGLEARSSTGGHPAHRLRVRLADRALSSTNPLLAVAARLVELAGGRVTASEVLDLAGTDAVRRRFGLDDDDLERITDWVGAAGIRWGLDAGIARARSGWSSSPRTPGGPGSTGCCSARRSAATTTATSAAALPLDDVGSGDIDLLGRLAELLAPARSDASPRWTAAGPVAEWVAALREGVVGLSPRSTPTTRWQVAQFERELARAARRRRRRRRGRRSGSPTSAPCSSRGSAGGPTRANFRTGTLTVCTMVPMRSVPHRVVCLVGLDDGVFPRASAVDGDDVLARARSPASATSRSEDRQLLLDARAGRPRAPSSSPTPAPTSTPDSSARRPSRSASSSTPLDRTAADAGARAGRWSATRSSPTTRATSAGRPWWATGRSASTAAALAGAQAAWPASAAPAPPFLAGPLPARTPTTSTSPTCTASSATPSAASCAAGSTSARRSRPTRYATRSRSTLDALEQWSIGDRLLREVLRGVDPAAVLTAELLRGTLPPGGLGRAGAARRGRRGPAAVRPHRRPPRPASRAVVDVDVDLGDGRRLTGTVAGVHGARLRHARLLAAQPRQRLRAWIDLLALSAAHPDQHWTAHAVGRDRAGPQRALAGPLDDRATELAARPGRAPRPRPVRAAPGADQDRLRLGRGPRQGADGRPTSTRRPPPSGSGAPMPTTASASAARTPTRPTSVSTAVGRRSTGFSPSGLADHAWTVWEPLLTGGERVAAAVTSPRPRPGPSTSAARCPTGTTLLEASAGTGKTWTIGALVTRYVAEGVAPLDEMLVVTFGRAASQELRERVRAQLVEAERALGDDPAPGDDPSDLVRLLLRPRRRGATAAAHRNIARRSPPSTPRPSRPPTSSARWSWARSGVAGDTDARARLVEDLDELLGEVVDDLYLRAFAYGEGEPAFTYAEALSIAPQTAIADPQARLEPADAGGRPRHGAAGRRSPRRSAPSSSAASGGSGSSATTTCSASSPTPSIDDDAPARARMRQRWRIVLVDEFQDTDPVQWQVLDRAFRGHATMVLIGDPKQAIYAFRGGDVVTYLDAADTAPDPADARGQLAQRRDAARPRSRPCSRGAALGDPRIVVHDVTAHHQGRRLAGAPRTRRSGCGWSAATSSAGAAPSRSTVGQVRPHVAHDLADDVHAAARSATPPGTTDPSSLATSP